MKPHECLFFLRHIAIRRGGMEKFVHYLDDHLPATFSHPLKTMEDCDMLSFLHWVLQVYLEFWNSSNPLEEYVPDFTKPSRCVQDEWVHWVTFSSQTHQKLPISTQHQHGWKNWWTTETEHGLNCNFRQVLQYKYMDPRLIGKLEIHVLLYVR